MVASIVDGGTEVLLSPSLIAIIVVLRRRIITEDVAQSTQTGKEVKLAQEISKSKNKQVYT